MPIVFTPRDIVKYSESIELTINGLHTVEIRVRGEGVPLKIDLEKQEDSVVDFGVAKVGQDVTKIVHLVNQSKKTVRLSMDVDDQLKTLSQLFIQVLPSRSMVV